MRLHLSWWLGTLFKVPGNRRRDRWSERPPPSRNFASQAVCRRTGIARTTAELCRKARLKLRVTGLSSWLWRRWTY